MVEPKQEQPAAFVIGWPIDHSRSPLIHGHWLQRHGLSGSYTKYPCAPGHFEAFVGQLPQHGFVGGNVTMPHKETAFLCATETTPTAKRLKAVNTLWLEDGVLCGDNTDGYGFLANLDQHAPNWDAAQRQAVPCLVLGAGGAARAIVDGLVQRGFNHIILANRTVERAEALLNDLAPDGRAIPLAAVPAVAGDVGLIVNTTSVGMEDGTSPMDLSAVHGNALVTDIVYTPLLTPLLHAAAERGLASVDGLGMLLHQAVPGFERWFGERPTVNETLRHVVLNDLQEDA
ncbi:MAG: shikimate dehydrogenase [Pseudomonadota bacterium]